MALLEIRNVTRRYGELAAVESVSFSVEAGEFFTLLGPSGCGKTTLLRMIAGFESPDAGQILLDGVDLADTPAEKRPIHTVFQSYALFPHMTVAENIAFPLKMAGRDAQTIRERVKQSLAEVRLEDKADRYPNEISGGQKQRVALARGLINRPRLLLLDEALGALDAKLREKMQIELINLQKNIGISFVFVTHAQDEALALSHRIAVMREGRVEQIDEPARIYGFPRSRFVADFIGNINLFEVEVKEAAASHLRLAATGLGEFTAPPRSAAKAGEPGWFAIRPEQVRIARHHEIDLKNRFAGKVQDLLYIGDVTTYKVALENGTLIEALMANSESGRATLFQVGDEVTVAWRHDTGRFLDE